MKRQKPPFKTKQELLRDETQKGWTIWMRALDNQIHQNPLPFISIGLEYASRTNETLDIRKTPS